MDTGSIAISISLSAPYLVSLLAAVSVSANSHPSAGFPTSRFENLDFM